MYDLNNNLIMSMVSYGITNAHHPLLRGVCNKLSSYIIDTIN